VVAKHALTTRRFHAATLIVPMTLVNRQYFDEIIGALGQFLIGQPGNGPELGCQLRKGLVHARRPEAGGPWSFRRDTGCRQRRLSGWFRSAAAPRVRSSAIAFTREGCHCAPCYLSKTTTSPAGEGGSLLAMSRQTFIFVGVLARDDDLIRLIEQELGASFRHEEGSGSFVRVGSTAVYLGAHEFDDDDIAWPGGSDIPLYSGYPAMLEIRDTGGGRQRQQVIGCRLFRALGSAGRWPAVYIDDMQQVLASFRPDDEAGDCSAPPAS
jgi:hypothetical protein